MFKHVRSIDLRKGSFLLRNCNKPRPSFFFQKNPGCSGRENVLRKLLRISYCRAGFLWLNRSVHGEGKWFAKFRTGKCRPGIAFRDHLYESVPFTGKQPRRPETGIKDSFEEMEHEFSVWNIPSTKLTTFSDDLLVPEIFRWEELKSRVPFTPCLGQDSSPIMSIISLMKLLKVNWPCVQTIQPCLWSVTTWK